MKSRRTKADAELMFVRRGMPLAEIAERVEVSKATVARWSKAGDWMQKRREHLKHSPSAALDKLRERRRRIIEEMAENPEDDPTIEDRLAKITKIIETMEAKQEAIGPVLDTMQRFAEFVARTCDDAATVDLIRKATSDFLDDVRRQAHG